MQLGRKVGKLDINANYLYNSVKYYGDIFLASTSSGSFPPFSIKTRTNHS